MSPEQRQHVLAYRQLTKVPLHSPPRWNDDGRTPTIYLLTAACYEHAHLIGKNCSRQSEFTNVLLDTARSNSVRLYAWCVLTNHYHLLIETPNVKDLTKELGRLHGRTSRCWNLQDSCVGRTVWHRCSDRRMRSDAHFWTSMNYVHNNPVKHGLVAKWTDWPWSSASEYLEKFGPDEATRIWRDYPLKDYGSKWDR